MIERDLLKAGRLTTQLPPESRLMVALSPAKDWNWDKEVQSRILAELDRIACMFANSHKKKSAKSVEPAEQFQPDYVKQAKEDAEKKKQAKFKRTDEEMNQIRNFWQQRQKKVKML